MRYEVRAFIEYAPDLDRIANNHVRIALAGGTETRNRFFHQTSIVIAERLGAMFAEFPGGHSAPMETPSVFADALRGLFERLGS
ncbi:MAG TPA: hypothetical protein VFB38_10650 [Chthonomonadaceae bacterium]|nr:hypothetical protein [Chthonomonadaceae bacterium]